MCPCGRPKSRMLQAVQLDAAQFFKAASVERGTRRVHDMLSRITDNTGKDAVAVYRLPQAKGYLCPSTKKTSTNIQVISFRDIRSALLPNGRDHRFLVGNSEVKRRGCWPMGASLSEPCTMCDINHDVWHCTTKLRQARRCGWITPEV